MLTINLFDALISPILLYGSEIWGVDCNDQIEKDPAELQSQSKWLGHFGVSLSPQCWCTRLGDRTAINNFERDEVSKRREKTAFGKSVPTIFV